MKSVILDQTEDGWREEIGLVVSKVKTWEGLDIRGLNEGVPIALITWFAGDAKTGQRNSLRPLTASELKLFGELCLEVAKTMEKTDEHG